MTLENRVKAIENHMMTGGYRETPVNINYIDAMSGVNFERFLGDLFRMKGFSVEFTPTVGNHVADLILERLGEKTAVQAKCYNNIVSNEAVQQVIGAKALYKCQKAIVASYFSRGAKILAEANEVELWDRNRMQQELKNFQFLHSKM